MYKGKEVNKNVKHIVLSIKLQNSEQSYKGKVKINKYINIKNQSTTENCENRNDTDMV
jgi:hypothetical protein